MSTLYPTLAAVLWDFDGTLADTEPLWIEAEYELITRLGGTWSEEQANELVGASGVDVDPGQHRQQPPVAQQPVHRPSDRRVVPAP